MGKKNGLADPSRLDPLVSQDMQLLRVVVETPKGNRNKFAFNPDEHTFELKKVLPAGMALPYDFGFVPSAKATTAILSAFSCSWISQRSPDACLSNVKLNPINSISDLLALI